MSRPLRIDWPGGLFHVTARGDRREPIVEDDVDRRAWVELLGDTCQRLNWRVHAWCLMSNHYHLLLEVPEGNLSHGMRHLNGVWSQQFNRRHRRVGHVFQGRFKAIVVERETYLLELARYVVLNPVRAGMVADAAGYPWSSYADTVAAGEGGAGVAGWFEAEWLLAHFSGRRAEAAAKYVDFVRAGVGLPSVWEQLQGQIFLGSKAFLEAMQQRLADPARLRDVPLLQQRPARRPLESFVRDLSSPSRDDAIVQACRSGRYTQAEVAAFFGVHESTVSRLLKRPATSADESEPPRCADEADPVGPPSIGGEPGWSRRLSTAAALPNETGVQR